MKYYITFIGTHCSGKTSYAIDFIEQITGKNISTIPKLKDGKHKITVSDNVRAL